MSSIITIENLEKTFQGGQKALVNFSLKVNQGEILALLGPNGAGKTTLISIICGIVTPSSGAVLVGGFDVLRDYKSARSLIGLVPQEIVLDSFETVINTVRFTRGLFGKPKDDAYIEKILQQLSLWDKRNARNLELSGGMKKRVLIAKALSHKPKILFLDEPSAGVDVELRKDMWKLIRDLKKEGVTIILTTHYIEEAEAIADRIGVINQGEIILVEEKKELLKKMGQKTLTIELQERIEEIPKSLEKYNLNIGDDNMYLNYTYSLKEKQTGITNLLQDLKDTGLKLRDLKTEQSNLENIFVNLVRENNEI